MPDRPSALRRLSSKAKASLSLSRQSASEASDSTTENTTDNTDSKLLSSLDEVTHGGSQDDSGGQEINSGPGDGTSSQKAAVQPPDLLDLPENPASRWYLHARAYTLRQAASLGFSLQHRADPPAPSPTQSIWIDSTLSKWSGKSKILLDIWKPRANPRQLDRIEKGEQVGASKGRGERGRVGMIVFHGGGFILGAGTDDSRWAGALMEHMDAIVIAINYRCAPGYPFPTPVEDCAEGILHVARNASTYGIDLDRLFLSGFSAGGNLVFASYFLLQNPTLWGYPAIDCPRIRGIIGFYPLLDFTISRKDKRDGCSHPQHTLPDSLTNLFDQSYLHPPPDRSDPRISPAKAPDEMLRQLPNVHLCCCEYDMLLAEGKAFRDRLERLGKEVSWREVKEEKHGWDKPPPMSPKSSVREEYNAAIDAMKKWLGNEWTEAEAGQKGVQEVTK